MSRQKQMFTAACRLAYHRLLLNYFTFCEIRRDGELHPGNQALFQQFEELLSLFLQGSLTEERLSGFRDQMVREMQHLTDCAASLALHEYAMNRTEPRFVPQDDPELDSTDKRINWTMQFILRGAESGDVNQRIRTVLEELPIRLTNSRFFALLRQGLSVYQEGDLESLDSILEVIRSQAFLIRPEGEWSNQEEEKRLLGPFEGADYRKMDLEAFTKHSEALCRAEEEMDRLSDHQLLLTGMANDLYVLVLGLSHSSMTAQEQEDFRGTLEETMELFGQENLKEDEVDRKAGQLLEPLEGGQEASFEQWRSLSLKQDEDFEDDALRKIGRLLSTSAFAPLEQKEKETAPVSEALWEERISRLEEELSASWKGRPRLMVRGIMAKILSCLPVFFGSLEQLQEYVAGSLESCLDDGEAIVSIHLIQEQSAWDESLEQEDGDEMVGSPL